MKSLADIAEKSVLSQEDLVKIEEYILNTGYLSPEKTRQVIEWFTLELGIDEYYFQTTNYDDIARHILAISASELVTQYGGEGVGIQLMNEHSDRAIYIVEEVPSKTDEIEKRIEKLYPMHRLESYLTKKKVHTSYLRFYIVTKPVFNKGVEKKEKLAFEDVADKAFMIRSAPETIKRYREAWESMNNRESPYISITDKPKTGETRVMVGIHGEKIRQFLNNFSRLFDKHNIHSNRKYREIFFDQKKVYSFYFNKVDRETLEEFSLDLNSVVMMPEHPVVELFMDKVLSPQQTMYAVCGCSFTHQFMTALTDEYITLSSALKDQPEAKGILDTMKLRFVKDTFSESRISQTVLSYPDIVIMLYNHFVKRLHPRKNGDDLKSIEKEIFNKIELNVPSAKDRKILSYFIKFNNLILRTNFFMRDKTCMSFRLDPSFLNRIDYPDLPCGLFFFVGREFIGFHIRFRDIARGGIRIVRSRNLANYEKNLDTIFLENYNLAFTQQKKNKDIPEGGSKGTLLLYLRNQEEGDRAFKSYIDGMMDLIMPNEEIKDLYGRNEILFLGPDEGTAELMNWATLYARKRQYPFWKAFTTGKNPKLGGIPHDMYGMTTNGVHEYVLCLLEKLGLKEEEIVKVQTGGPDGDLGSNEILFSKDKTMAVVDGSGVLYDPKGINRRELVRLAKKRVMVENFDRSLLSPEGFFVSINDKDVKLPDGTVVYNGEEFRNTFHLNPMVSADLFVPCGGRPASVNINNWQKLLTKDGKPRFRLIVEGANLFITEDARLRLEENGVIIIKDASANKGGVTSSSFEVFASLAMSDEEFDRHLRVEKDVIPQFRKAYVEEIIKIIKKNARKEFNLLWNEHNIKKIPFTTLTNLISYKINSITDAVVSSNLVKNKKLRDKVIESYTPRPLLELVGIEKLVKRVPENYLNAIFATKMATDFVYSFGLDATEVDFYNYINSLSA